MNRVIVVVFNERSQAFEGVDALKSLDRDDALMLHEYAIIERQPDGTCMVVDGDNNEGLRTVLGTSLGTLIGLLGGPLELPSAQWLEPWRALRQILTMPSLATISSTKSRRS